jgi:glycosyltransferase involved in cell wall biosynthesis
MNLLFISTRDVDKKSHGGYQCTNRNYLSFCEILGKQNVELFNLTSDLKKGSLPRVIKWINYLHGHREGLSLRKLKYIINRSNEKDYIFIDSSQFGIIAYHLKKAGYGGTIICFFHNVEYNIARIHARRRPLSSWRILLNYYNEKKAVKYSDRLIVLNTRDLADLKRSYKIRNASIIPISLIDSYSQQSQGLTSNPPTLLFIGNEWYPNIHGLKWFVKHVLDHVNVRMQIVGTGMDKFKKKFLHHKIEFLGFVPDLSSVLIEADYVISPIFIGGGMKVKTCESLMYGKNIIGTKEAFEGYDIEYNKVGALCGTKTDFIETINRLSAYKREKFNKHSRQYFLENYSFQATLKKFCELLNS